MVAVLRPRRDLASAGATSEPAPAQGGRGEMIYLRGESPSGREITARIGDGQPLRATTLACVQCHGVDAKGRPEGGVTPSDITWDKLSRPYGVTHPDGRRHPAYTPALFGRAVTMGWDPAGQTLSLAMPRYQIAPEDLSDLIAYIRQIDHVSVPGVSQSSIRIGIVLPADSQVGAATPMWFSRPSPRIWKRSTSPGGFTDDASTRSSLGSIMTKRETSSR